MCFRENRDRPCQSGTDERTADRGRIPEMAADHAEGRAPPRIYRENAEHAAVPEGFAGPEILIRMLSAQPDGYEFEGVSVRTVPFFRSLFARTVP